MATPRFPVEPVRDRYVSPFGGFSESLEEGEVGVNALALAENTSLAPGQDHVLVSSDLDGRARPLFTRPYFRVVALPEDDPDTRRFSPEGEVVFSSQDFGGSRDSIFDALRRGAYVVLNATLSRWQPGGAVVKPGTFGTPGRRVFTPREPF